MSFFVVIVCYNAALNDLICKYVPYKQIQLEAFAFPVFRQFFLDIWVDFTFFQKERFAFFRLNLIQTFNEVKQFHLFKESAALSRDKHKPVNVIPPTETNSSIYLIILMRPKNFTTISRRITKKAMVMNLYWA